MKNPKIPGKIYLVGGAVRDKILGLPHKESDYVVIGTTPEAMTQEGFIPVGKAFPVFLHPDTHEEYALARTERKISRGHQGFNFYTDPSISLEEDLIRRDLTINAIAEDAHGNITDPYQGQEDLKQHILRHVSPAFSEDPLRIFRVARFRAYLGRFNFTIAAETLTLMQDMVAQGVINELSDERIWQELEKALNTTHPELFFMTLKELNALESILPKLTEQGLNALTRAKKNVDDQHISFASLSFEGPYLKKAPNDFADLQELVMAHYDAFAKFETLNTDKKLNLLHALDFLRRPNRAENFLASCFAITENNQSLHAIRNAIKNLKTLDRAQLSTDAKAKGMDIKSYIAKAELSLIET